MSVTRDSGLDDDDDDASVDERDAGRARGRHEPERGLQQGAQGAGRLLVPALWGAALLGGALLAMAVWRGVRRPRPAPALLRVSIEPRFEVGSFLPAVGGVMARFALQRWLGAADASAEERAVAAETTASVAPTPSSPTAASSHLGSSNGHSRT